MNNKKIVGNGSKATLPGGQKLSDKIQENKVKNNIGNNTSRGTNSTSTSSSNEQQGNQKGKSGLGSNAQAVGTEAAKEGLKKAAGTIPWTKWIPKGIRDKIIDKFMDSGAGQAAVEKTMKSIKNKIMLLVISAVGSLLLWLFGIVMIFTLISGPVAWISDALGAVGGFFASVGNWFAGNGWCASEGECQQNAEYQYYEKLNEAVSKYSGSCEINEDLITATIFYGQMVSEKKLNLEEKKDDETDTDADNYFNYLDVSKAALKQPAKSQVNKLIRVYLKGENIDLDSAEAEDLEITDGDTCSVSAAAYRRYLIDTYIKWAYPDVITETRTIEMIADEIMTMGNIALINRAFSSSIYCPTISVEQKDGTIEPMDLETYVARVVTKENPWNVNGNIENMKAQAIAARTYALNYTNNCKNPIKNSATTQTLADTASADGIRAAEETNSLVLLKDGKVFSTQYDALAIDYELTSQKNDDNYYIKQVSLAISKSWLDSKLTQSDYDFYKNNSHGNGMSQWGSRYLQHIGKNYEEILNTFYTMAEITKMGGLISGGNYSSNIGPAVDVNELAERRDYYFNEGITYIYSNKSSNVSQCPWYAKSRAIEIVYGSNMPDELKQTAINSLRATHGNGADWFNTPDATIFTKTTDYAQPVPGSIVSWSSGGGSQCHKYGHVAIVEQVMEDGTVLLSDSYNRGGADSGNSWSKIAYRTYNVSLDYIKSHINSSGCTYTFNGYVYLLG